MNSSIFASPARALALAVVIAFLPASSRAIELGLTLTSLYAFPSNQSPSTRMVQGTNGNFYGTTLNGGTNGLGTVFEIAPDGTYTTLLSFNGTNGSLPAGDLLMASNGNFYGTTSAGGYFGRGTIYEMTQRGGFTLMQSFGDTNGSNPAGGLVQGTNGDFYGTTSAGGTSNFGTIFEWSPEHVITLLYSFSETNGWDPQAGLVFGFDGNLYGTTYYGGSNNMGTVFQFTPSDLTLSPLLEFSGTNGAFPLGLVQTANSNLYGVTFGGGSNGFGTIFSITYNGTLSTLENFALTNGSNPHASLLVGADGNLYGSTVQGGSGGKGLLFELATTNTANTGGGFGGRFGHGGFGGGTSGSFSNLYSFTGTLGAYPMAPLIQGSDGNFYGTTTAGAGNNYGDIFQLSGFAPGIGKEPATQPYTPGKSATFTVTVGGSATLNYQWMFDGTNLTGATNKNLTISNETLANVGTYSVVVANTTGAATSTVAELSIPAPSVTISKPPASVTNAPLTINGSASGKYGITNVEYSLNGSAFQPATMTTTNWSKWTVALNLTPGSNTFSAFSVDPVGNHSTTNTVDVFFTTYFHLTLVTNGFGSIKTSFTGTNLIVGKPYTVTASPKTGNLFSNWVGTGITSADNPFTFVITNSNPAIIPSVTLAGNFVTNPFIPTAATYEGLFYVSTNIADYSSGQLKDLVVRSTGAYTAKVYIAGSNYSVMGNFDLTGNATNTITRTRAEGPMTLVMNLDLVNSPTQTTGSVSGTNDGGWTAPLLAEAAVTQKTSTNFTMLLPPGPGAPTNSPGGVGYALITDKSGTVTLSGALADGKAFSSSVLETKILSVPFYASPYTNGGVLFGWLDFSHGAPSGNVVWIAPTNGTVLFTNGFTNIVAVASSVWVAPAARTAAITLADGQLVISNDYLPVAPLVYNVALSNNNVLAELRGSPTNSLSATVNAANGLLTVTFGDGNGKTKITGKGAILQNQNSGAGFFSTTTNAGAIILQP